MTPLALVLLLTTPAADWPQFRGPAHDGHSAEAGFDWDWRKAPPREAWAVPVGRGFAGVAVSGGSVFVLHTADGREVLDAFDPATGQRKWRAAGAVSANDGPNCTPIVHAGRVFTFGAGGELAATDAATGRRLWARNVLREFAAPPGYFGVGAGPIVLGDVLVVNVGAKRAGIVGFDPATGKDLWTATGDGPGYSSPAPITLGGKPHAAVFTRAGLVLPIGEAIAVVHAAGGVATTHPFRSRLDASVNAAAPVVAGDEVFLSAQYGTGAVLLKLAAGKEPAEGWADDRSLTCHFNTPVKVGGHLYGVHGRQEGGAELRCVEWATGAVKWANDGFGCAHLIHVDGGLLAVTEAGGLVRVAADPAGYREAGHVRLLPGLTRAAPALADGRLYVRDDTTLACWRLK